MPDIGSVETSTVPEGEKLAVHPLNQLDNILYQVATEDFKDNPSVFKVLAGISERYFKDAEHWRKWFSGQAEDYGGQGIKAEALSRPTTVAHVFPQHRLDGGSAPDFVFMLPHGSMDKIHILLDGKGTVLDKKDGSSSSIPDPKLTLYKHFNPRRDRALAWGISFTIPVRIFDKTLKQPLTPSKFTAVPAG